MFSKLSYILYIQVFQLSVNHFHFFSELGNKLAEVPTDDLKGTISPVESVVIEEVTGNCHLVLRHQLKIQKEARPGLQMVLFILPQTVSLVEIVTFSKLLSLQ